MTKYSCIVLLAILFAWCFTPSCTGEKAGDGDTHPAVPGALPDTLRVGTLYSPTSYFIYRGQPMGYDYDLMKKLADDKGMELKIEVANSLAAAVEMLDSGKIDVIAYEVPITSEYKGKVIPAGNENITHQVLVQPNNDSTELITDVTQLVGREVFVEGGSKYHHRLENLNEELGGGIKISPIDRDTLITEDLIAMVQNGDIPLTIVDSDIAALNKTYYNDLDIGLELSFPQRAAWGVSPSKPWLADSINAWVRQQGPRQTQAMLLKRYFERSKNEFSGFESNFPGGRISPYDNLFKKYAAEIGWDWRLLAAQSYTESRFDPKAESWAGAKGLMQIMPGTARDYGLTPAKMWDPESSIATSVKIIADLDKWLQSRIPDKEARQKFIIGAYNSGVAHVYDAVALAKKYGLDPGKWDGNVEKAMLMKTNPRYYKDPVVKYGYSRGRQTYEYVRKIYSFYEKAKQKVPL